jgi:hypothetical protein
MKSRSVRRRAGVLVSLLAAISLVAVACIQPAPTSGWPSFTFKATSVTAADQTEYTPLFWNCVTGNCYDEPYLVNIAFRVKIGKPNSASAWVVDSRGASPEPTVCKTANQQSNGEYCDNGSETEALAITAQQAQVTFGNVSRFDVADLLNTNNKLEVVGVWTWAMEEDLMPNLTPGSLASIIQSALNSTLATGSVPNDPNLLAQLIVDNIGDAIAIGGSSLLNALSGFLFGLGDDVLSSKMYVYVGSTGTLAGIINAASVNLAGFNADLASVGIPNVDGITVRATAPSTLTNQAFVGSGADHRYTFTTS